MPRADSRFAWCDTDPEHGHERASVDPSLQHHDGGDQLERCGGELHGISERCRGRYRHACLHSCFGQYLPHCYHDC